MNPSQPADDASNTSTPPAGKKKSELAKAVIIFFGLLLAWFVFSYIVAPLLWKKYETRHPAFDELPGLTQTGDHHPGDPINVALIGTEQDLQHIMLAAGWYPADPITLKSSLKIALGTVLRRQYDDAPVSSLYLWGRKQDLAFEMPVGNSPSRRHHVRFWKSAKVDDAGRPAWAGSATYDKSVGLSHATGQITHHIDGDVDQERNHLIDSLQKTGDLLQVEVIAGFHKVLQGRNGGNDAWHTDGDLKVGNIKPIGESTAKLPEMQQVTEAIDQAESPAKPAASPE